MTSMMKIVVYKSQLPVTVMIQMVNITDVS